MRWFWRRKKIACESYERLAEIYDFVMRHVDYKGWADYIESIFSRYGVRPTSILDLACGTGTLALELFRRGYSVMGIDGSESMVAVAERKAESIGARVPFRQMDMLSLKDVPTFDSVLCLYDSLNYLLSEEEIGGFLQSVRKILLPGCLLIFDVCTERNSLLYFRDSTEEERGDGFSYIRHSRYNPRTRIQINRFEINFDGENRTFTETHRQRIYTVGEIVQVIESSAFDLVGTYDGFTFNPVSEDSERIHFVLQLRMHNS